MNATFQNIEALKAFTEETGRGAKAVTYRNMPDYPGMVFYIGLHFDVPKKKYELNLEWMSLGLDFYGDTLQESYMYSFGNLDQLLAYLQSKYDIAVTDIAVRFEFDPGQYPSLLKDEHRKPEYEAAWQKFREDFKRGLFLDGSQNLVYASSPTDI
jgi:hypothetical protein